MMSHEEIAAELGISRTQVIIDEHRALRKIALALDVEPPVTPAWMRRLLERYNMHGRRRCGRCGRAGHYATGCVA